MRKRVKLKKQKHQNHRAINKLLGEIGETLSVENKEFGNGYFLFHFGSSSVCHFTLKETPEWRYGIWLIDGGHHIFGEHVDLIDKFKPSRTYISHKNDIQAFVESVEKVAKKPKLYFVDSLTGVAFIDFKEETLDGENWHTGYQVNRLYNEETGLWDIIERDTNMTQDAFVKKKYEQFQKEKLEQKENEAWDRAYAFDFFPTILSFSEHIIGVGVRDQNKGGVYCSPRYEIDVVLNASVSKEDVDKLYLSLDSLIHEKNYSDDRKTYEHQFSLEGMYEGMNVLKEADYSFKKEVQLV